MNPEQVTNPDDSIDDQCNLSKSFLDKEDIEYTTITMPQKLHNQSGETVITKTMQDNLKPFQFKKTTAVMGNRVAGVSPMRTGDHQFGHEGNYLQKSTHL